MLGRFAGEKFNLLNPFTYGNLGKARDNTIEGDPNVEYSDSPVGNYSEAINKRNRMLKELLGN